MSKAKGDATMSPSAGPPFRSVDLASSVVGADLIVVATVLETTQAADSLSLVSKEAEAVHDQLRQAELSVVRTIAGDPFHGRLRVLFLEGKVPSRPWLKLTQGQTVLLFLCSVGESYVPVVPVGAPILTLPEIAPPPAGSSRTQAVAHELEQIILNADPKAQLSLIVQASLARVGLRSDLDHHLLDTPALQEPEKRAAWIAIALAEGKTEALDSVAALFAHLSQPPVDVLWNLIVQKVGELRAPTARAQLATLLDSPSVELARAAAVALRQLHDPATVPDLIAALDNADQDVRYQALMGLAELEPAVEAGPSHKLYRSDEARYIGLWKQWWASSGRSRMAK